MGGSARRSLKHVASAGLARLARRPRLNAAELLALRPRTILVVRQHNQMGDMVCATPALRAIRETWPDAHIVLVTAPVNVEVVRHNPHVDQVLTFAQRPWWRLGGFGRRLRGLRPDLAFVLSSVSFSVTSAAIALASGARWVVGADSRPYGWDVSRHAFSLELPSRPVPEGSAVAHNLEPLAAVGITTDDLSTVVQSAVEEIAAADQVLTGLGLAPGFWALHPGAGKVQNVWPARRFGEIAGRAAAAGHQVLVLHGPADAAAVEVLEEMSGPHADRVRIAPALAVGTAAALLGRADRLLCNDTGIMHVAGAVGVPTLALFGPTDTEIWKPSGVTAVRSPGRSADERGREFGWMENITVDEVWRRWSALPVREV